jgi:signal peptidase I
MIIMVKFVKPKSKESIVLPLKDTLLIIKSKLSFLSWLDPFTYVDLFVMPHVKRATNRSSTAEFVVNILFAFLFAFLAYSILGFLFGTSSPLVIVYSASMEPTFFRGDVMALGSVNQNDYLGPEIILPSSIELKNNPTINFATPLYSDSATLSLEKIIFSCDGNCLKEIVPDKNGIVVVYPAFNPNFYTDGIPIIHRSVAKLIASDGNFILTKGDNSLTNPTFDEDCGRINTELNIPQKGCISLYAIPTSSIQGKAFFRIPFVGCFKLWLVDDLSSLVFNGRLPSDFKGIC